MEDFCILIAPPAICNEVSILFIPRILCHQSGTEEAWVIYIYIYIYSYSYTEAWTIRSQLSSHCVSSTLPAHSLQVDRNMSVQHTALPKIQLTQATFTSDLVTAYTDSNGSIWWGDKKSKHDSQQELKAEHWSQWEPPLTHSWLLFCGQWSQQPSRNGIIKSNSQGWCVINQSMFPTASAH